jgi:hypothetical protein
VVELDPDKRNWEYDGDGNKIYKIDVGKPFKTKIEELPWDEQDVDLDGGVPWIKQSDIATMKMNGDNDER